MKRLLFICLIAFAVSTANAAQVSPTTARTVASNFLQNLYANSVNLTLVYSHTDAFYVFGHQTGFVIVAADNRVTPILVYSTESAFRVPQNEADTVVGNNFWGWMRSYEVQINYMVDNNIPATNEITDQWNHLIIPGSKTTAGVSSTVAPLLTTTWDQGWPYNALCPPGTAAGCVATAMAQIMKFHNWPAQGLGSYGYTWGSYPTSANFGATTYNWGNMPNSITTLNNDVATILYHAGVSCRAMWGGSTGVAYSSDQDPMSRAFINYFRMAASTTKYVKKTDYTDVGWDNLIHAELAANRPVYYPGSCSPAYSFITLPVYTFSPFTNL